MRTARSSAASTTSTCRSSAAAGRQLEIDGKPAPPGEKPQTVTMLSVGPRYFDALGVSLVRGRALDRERRHARPRSRP